MANDKYDLSKGEAPGLSVFLKEGNDIFHTYSTYARGLDTLLVTYRLLDITPLGRQDEKSFRFHDEYEDGVNTKTCHWVDFRRIYFRLDEICLFVKYGRQQHFISFVC